MNESQAETGRPVRRLFISAAVLEAMAGTLAFAGLVVCTAAITAVTRQRVSNMEVPPFELARQQWARARAATYAGVGAWRGAPLSPRTYGMRRVHDTARL